MKVLLRSIVILTACLLLLGGGPGAALAYEFSRPLQLGDFGRDVKALQVRIAGWYPHRGQAHFKIDGAFEDPTLEALTAFQTSFGLAEDGVADAEEFDMLASLQDSDGSTLHFDFEEFTQNSSSSCSAKANAYAGTFDGGMVSPTRALSNVKRLMWRLEALRAKVGDEPVGINSGFRSVAYNDCIGGARASQHMYGTAADNRVANVGNRRARRIARGSQIHGIGCYSYLTHNHFDLRLDNAHLPSSQFWWWPERDGVGRDLDESGSPCWGQKKTGSAVAMRALRSESRLATPAEIEAFSSAGEPLELLGAD